MWTCPYPGAYLSPAGAGPSLASSMCCLLISGGSSSHLQARQLDKQLALRIMMREEGLTHQLLCWAVLEGQTERVQWLLEHGGGRANSKDADGSAILHIACGAGYVDIVRLLLAARADPEARDGDKATPLVLACLHGRDACTQVLLEGGARVDSKWAHLRPIQWAQVRKHTSCARVCESFGANPHEAVPAGRGEALRRESSNRLLPAPLSVGARRRTARPAAAEKVSQAKRVASSPATWTGHRWANAGGRHADSLLAQLLQERTEHGPGKGPLCQLYPGLEHLSVQLKAYCMQMQGRQQLSPELIASFALRPGVAFESTKGGGQGEADRGKADGGGPSEARASLFASGDAEQCYVEVDHQPPDTLYKRYFAALSLCFRCEIAGEVHELCLLRYLYPDIVHNLPAEAAIPLYTKFVFTKRAHYIVVPVASLMGHARLYRPPRFRPDDPPYSFLLLCDDVVGKF